MKKKFLVKAFSFIAVMTGVIVLGLAVLQTETYATGELTIDTDVDISNLTDAEALVAIAMANNRADASSLGVIEGWCADFVFSCAKAAGISSRVIPYTGHPPTMYSSVLRAGGTLVYNAQPGDLVFYFYGDFCRHVGIAINSYQAINGNWGGHSDFDSYVGIAPIEYYDWMEIGEDYLIVRPNYEDGSGDPTGDLYGDYPCWRQVNGELIYMISPGQPASGWMRIGENWYFFNSEGAAQRGWKYLDGFWYYFDPSSGMMMTEWQEINGDRYYLGSEGEMQTGWQLIKGTWYYFASSGEMRTDWQKINGTWYYFNISGEMQTGLQQISGTWYYFRPSGAMATGWQLIDNTWYFFRSSGAMQTGWLKSGDTWYYLGSSGQMLTGLQQIDGTWYYLRPSGAMATGWQLIDNTWYFFRSSGAMQTGWLKSGDTWYYLGSSGQMLTGLQQIDGAWYYLRPSGAMATGWQLIDNAWYFFRSSGEMQTGWQQINGVWYYFKSTGIMASNEWVDGYWLSSGGEWTYKYRGSWQEDENGTRYMDTSGWYEKNSTVLIDGIEYSFDANGYLITADEEEDTIEDLMDIAETSLPEEETTSEEETTE